MYFVSPLANIIKILVDASSLWTKLIGGWGIQQCTEGYVFKTVLILNNKEDFKVAASFCERGEICGTRRKTF